MDTSNLPTEKEYRVLIQDLAKFALRKEQIDIREVAEVEYEKEKRSRENIRGGNGVER